MTCRTLPLLVILTLLASCSRSPPSKKLPSPPSVARVHFYADPNTLDTRKAVDFASRTMQMMLYEGLTRIASNGIAKLSAAEAVNVSEDQTVYTFRLRETYWTDGEPVTAQDFAYAWTTLLSPSFPAPFAYLFYVIEGARETKMGEDAFLGIEALDEQTLQVTLTHPAPHFLELVSTTPFYPLPHHHMQYASRALDKGELPTNGPFRFADWTPHQQLSVVKNPNYWDAKAVELDGITMVVVENELSGLQLFEKGELDLTGAPLSTIPLDALPRLKKKGLLKQREITGVYWYKINTDHPLLKNRKIRQALSYAINRDEINKYVTAETHPPAQGVVPLGDRLPLLTEATTYNPTKAKQLFQEGLRELNLTRDELPPVELSYNTREHHLRIAEAIQNQWRRVLGLEVSLHGLEWAVYFDKILTRTFDICRFAWMANCSDPIDCFNTFKFRNDRPGGWINDTGWEDPSFIALLDQIDQATDQQERERLLGEAEAVLVTEMPAIPLFFLCNNYLQSNQLSGLSFSHTGFVDFKEAKIEHSKAN